MKHQHYTVAGHEVLNAINEETERRVPKNGYYDSETLCALQVEQARRGYLGASICKTIYGWSLRYDSGLQNFGIIERQIPTFEQAIESAAAWVAQDPSRRYARCHATDLMEISNRPFSADELRAIVAALREKADDLHRSAANSHRMGYGEWAAKAEDQCCDLLDKAAAYEARIVA